MNNSSLSGNLDKRIITVGNKKFLVKAASDYNEAINEVLVSNLLDLLGIRHIKYTLDYASRYGMSSKGGFVSICEWLSTKEEVITFMDYLELTLGGACYTQGHKKSVVLYEDALLKLPKDTVYYICLTLYIDALVSNSDRHFGNIELINKGGILHPFPMYDFGMSFYSNNKWFKDKSMPFRLKHNTQLKFIKSLGFNNIIKDPQSLYLNWLTISSNILALTPRAKYIKDTLRYRIENINNFFT